MPLEEKSKLLYQLNLHDLDIDKSDKQKEKGHFIGFNVAKKILDGFPKYFDDKSNMEQLCYDFGPKKGFKFFKQGYIDLAEELDKKEKTDYYTKIAKEIMGDLKDQLTESMSF